MRKILYAVLLGVFAILGYCGPAFPQTGPYTVPGAGGQTPPPLGGTGAWKLTSVASPGTAASSSFVLMGLASSVAREQLAFIGSGTLQMIADGTMANGTLADGCSYELVWGPVAGATLSAGSAVPASWSVAGTSKTFTQEVATDQTPFSVSAMAQINPGGVTAQLYGFDVAIADVTGGTCTPSNVDIWVAEN